MTDIPEVLRIYCAGLKALDVDRIARTVSEDLAFVLPGRRLAKSQFLTMLRSLYAAFPDWHYEQAQPEARGAEIAIRWRQGGTHTATFALPGRTPVPPTGKRVQTPWQYFFYRVRDNLIVAIRPEQVPGGAPQGVFEQIGAAGDKVTR
jgi:predicted ester cyclase